MAYEIGANFSILNANKDNKNLCEEVKKKLIIF